VSKRYLKNEKNSPYRRGIVVERGKGRLKVQFGDEHEDQSYWLDLNQGASGKNQMFNMPDLGTQVGCLMDWDGEDGMVVGAVWSENHPPPTEENDNLHFLFSSGLEIIAEKGTGNVRVNNAHYVSVEATLTTIKGNVRIEGNLTVTGGIHAQAGVFSPIGVWPPIPVFVAQVPGEGS
jgi:phage baseplate assembly protein V